jgi:hypothetical protein
MAAAFCSSRAGRPVQTSSTAAAQQPQYAMTANAWGTALSASLH